MKEINYVMVTNWELHWDKLNSKWNNSTLYTIPVIRDGLATAKWPSEAVTLFIKRTKDNAFEKAWIGTSKNFRKDANNGKPAVRFEISDLVECDCPEEYKLYANGWHINKHVFQPSPTKNIAIDKYQKLHPAFFQEMFACNALTFELHCFHMFRVLGIHDIHKFPQTDNRGKADGFFRFHTLSVIYDATLESDFQKKKETQIENYINQLKKEKISLESISYSIKETQKQVWVITRGTKVRHIRTEDNIKVKEIPITKLIEVFNTRMTKEIGSEELNDILKDLD